MTKPEQSTRESDQYKRQLKILEMYLVGRTTQLTHIAKSQPGEAPACEMVISELALILTQVLPTMREVQS